MFCWFGHKYQPLPQLWDGEAGLEVHTDLEQCSRCGTCRPLPGAYAWLADVYYSEVHYHVTHIAGRDYLLPGDGE